MNPLSGSSTTGAGVTGTSVSGTGVNGTSVGGTGVFGSSDPSGLVDIDVVDSEAASFPQPPFGVQGYSHYGIGVYGKSYGRAGVYAHSTLENALYATSNHGQAAYIANTDPGNSRDVLHVTTAGTGTGISVSTTKGIGIDSESDSGIGVKGHNDSTASGPNTIGVFGSASAGTGVQGYSYTGTGIYGYSDGPLGPGVFGGCPNGIGVQAYTDSKTGIFSWVNDRVKGFAAWFEGNVGVNGLLEKFGGSTFKIDHPLDPARKYLSHSAVESPDMKNIYDGVVLLDANGEAEVELPIWFEALNTDFCYQLTCIGGYAPVYIAQEVQGNRFKIAGGTSGMKVSWQVTGIRQDAWAKAHRIQVEENKPVEEHGYYLHPELHGELEEKSIVRVRHPHPLPMPPERLTRFERPPR